VFHSVLVTPDYEKIEQAEAVAVRVALERGYLTMSQLREALLLREQLRMAGRQTRLLRLLGSRYIPADFQAELSRVYFAALNASVAVPEPEPEPEAAIAAPVDPVGMSSDELAIPEFMLQASSEQLERPVAEDPDSVQDFMRRSSELEVPESIRSPESGEVSESGLFRWLKDHLPGT
jgi:hypothetical protein